MDPNANIDEQLRIMKEIQGIYDKADPVNGSFTDDQRANLATKAIRLGELVEALDHWLTGGGSLPARWTLDAIVRASHNGGKAHGTREDPAAR